jgi:predicted PurR-regulated permease PerM
MRLSNFENRAFLTIVILTTIAFVWMVRGFLMPVFWAAVLAILFRPAFLRWKKIVRGYDAVAAALTLVTVIIVVLIPTGLLVGALAQQAVQVYQRIARGDIDIEAPIQWARDQLPALTGFLEQYGFQVDRTRESIEGAVVVVSQWVASQALTAGQNTLLFALYFGVMLYFLFFFVKDGARIVERIIHVLPLGDERERRLFVKFAQAARATVKGTLVVSAVQGGLGGIMFYIVGIEAAIFWAVIMGILSLLPAVGASLVWIPAATFFFATGTVWKGVFLVFFGAIVVGLVDNVLRPILVGRETKMPDYMVLLATLGGLGIFGISGFVIGPIIAALFLVVWEIFAEEYSELDTTVAPVLDAPPDTDPGPGIDVDLPEAFRDSDSDDPPKPV